MPSKWKNINTAPQDGTTIIIYADPDVLAAEYIQGQWVPLGWNDDDSVIPTLWQEMPKPPGTVHRKHD